MNKRNLTDLAILFVLIFSFALFVAACEAPRKTEAPAEKAATPAPAEKAEVWTVKGKVKGFANPKQSKTISVSVKDKGVILFKYNDATAFKNFTSLPELTGEAVVVEYVAEGPDNVATSITKALVKLPSGVAEIKTPEIAALVEKGPEAGNYFLADARPAKVYSQGYIPTAVSVPVTELKKQGAELLPADKDKPLIFYCGGPT